MPQDITKIKQEMVGYKYKHYKNEKIYLVLDIVIHTETQELMVVYRNINDEQVWCRPLSVFNEEIDNENHKRFEKIDDDSDWKLQQEQEIFKKFEAMGYEVEKIGNEIDFINRKTREHIAIFLKQKFYVCQSYNRYTAIGITIKIHQLLHRLFEIWNWI